MHLRRYFIVAFTGLCLLVSCNKTNNVGLSGKSALAQATSPSADADTPVVFTGRHYSSLQRLDCYQSPDAGINYADSIIVYRHHDSISFTMQVGDGLHSAESSAFQNWFFTITRPINSQEEYGPINWQHSWLSIHFFHDSLQASFQHTETYGSSVMQKDNYWMHLRK